MKIQPTKPIKNRRGELCGLCDGTHEHDHPQSKCVVCGVVGLAENMKHHTCEVQCTLEIIKGVEGYCVVLGNYRICGPKKEANE